MKLLLVFVAIFAVVLAAPPTDEDRFAQIKSQEFDNIGVDGFNFGFDTTNGIVRQESGEVKNIGTDDVELIVRGFFEWFDPTGEKHVTNFVADKDGYHPESSDIPKN